jgi:hypothetical protein
LPFLWRVACAENNDRSFCGKRAGCAGANASRNRGAGNTGAGIFCAKHNAAELRALGRSAAFGFLPAFSQTWSDSVFRPAEFFRRAPKTGNLGAALLYAILIVTTSGLLSIFWQYLFWDTFSNWEDLESILGQEISRNILGVWALLLPLFAIISLFISSFIFHLCLMIAGSSKNGYEATLRGLCYSYGPNLFVLIPFCGGLIAGGWIFVLMIIGWRELHESTTGRVLFAALLPFIVCCGALMMLLWSFAGLYNRLSL